MRDLTDRLRADESAAKTRDFYVTLFDTFPALVWRTDVDAKCDYFNQTWLNFTGRSLEQEKGDGWTEGVHPEDLADCLEKFRNAFHARQPFTLEYRLRRHDGEYRWINDRGKAFDNLAGQFSGYIGSCVDVTERRVAEEALRSRERDLSIFAAATNDTLWECDLATSLVKRSAGFERHFGYPASAIRPEIDWWLERVDPVDRDWVLTAFRAAAAGSATGASFQYRFRKHDRSYVPVEDRVGFVRDASGKAIRALGAMTDLTQQLEHQAEVRRILHQLVVAEENERRRIAKELHDSTVQGLVAAMVNLEFLREQTDGRTPLEMRQIEDSLALLENCAYEVRTLSYLLHPPQLDEAGLPGAIRQYATGFGERTGIDVTVTMAEKLPRLGETVEMTLFRVVQEALGNIHRHAHSKTASIRERQEGSEILLEISDEGCGIPPKLLAGPMGRLTGLGVGISGMCERLRLIGGRLHVESSERGTTVRAVVAVPKGHG